MPNSVLFIDVMPSLVALGCITKIPLGKQLLPKSHQIPRPFKISLNGRTEIECVRILMDVSLKQEARYKNFIRSST